MVRRASALSLLALLASLACNAAPPLDNSRDSPEALASAVLDALALDEQEFRDHVWPALPAARPERNLPFSYVWGDLHGKSNSGLATTLTDRGGQRYEVSRVSFAEATDYEGYRVHRDATFHVRNAGGTESEIRVCGSMIEKDGAWKVFSYVVD